MRKYRVAATAALLLSAGALSTPVVAQAAASTTYYVDDTAGTACSDTTANSTTAPYCTIQAAVDAASAPGDTVIVDPGTYAPFTVTSSGTASAPITIKSTGADFRTPSTIVTSASGQTSPIVTLTGASYVTVQGFQVRPGSASTALAISGSNHVTVNSNEIAEGLGQGTTAGVLISDSPDVTLSRNVIYSLSLSGAVDVRGGSDDVITTNDIPGSQNGPSISLDQNTGSDVTGNTISLGCEAEILVAGDSTSTTIENNVLTALQPHAEGCPELDTASYALVVDSTSTTGTTADYNDVFPFTSPATSGALGFYSWAGATYATAASFAATTGEGAHDLDSAGTAAKIDSANSAAPGELSTDIWGEPHVDDPSVANTGVGPYSYYDRGAEETVNEITITRATSWPTQLPVSGEGTFDAGATGLWTGDPISTCTYDFGDGTPTATVTADGGQCTTQHAYASTGDYTVTLTATAASGSTATSTASEYVDAAASLSPRVSLTTTSARDVQATNSGSSAWNILECDFDFGDGTAVTTTSGTDCQASHHYTTVGTFTVTLTVKDSGGNTAASSSSFASNGYYFTPMAPTRVLDTRKGTGVPSVAKVAPGGTVRLELVGNSLIQPAAGATAAVLNVTVTDAVGAGYVTVYPDDTAMPNASNLNFNEGQVIANTVTVKLGADGAVLLKNSSTGTIDLVADLEGYYAVSGDGYVTSSPQRLVDTRVSKTTLPAGGTIKVDTNTGAGPDAVLLNVTVTNPTGTGYITVYEDGTAMPNASNVNFTPHETIANEDIAEISELGGVLDFTNRSTGSVDLVVDESGYFQYNVGAAFVPMNPTRYLDTRKGIGEFSGNLTSTGALASFGTGALTISGIPPISGQPAQAKAIAANITVTQPAAGGYITAYPANETPRPTASTLNFSAGETIPNAATVQLSDDATDGIDLYNGSPGTVQLIVDVEGYYA